MSREFKSLDHAFKDRGREGGREGTYIPPPENGGGREGGREGGRKDVPLLENAGDAAPGW